MEQDIGGGTAIEPGGAGSSFATTDPIIGLRRVIAPVIRGDDIFSGIFPAKRLLALYGISMGCSWHSCTSFGALGWPRTAFCQRIHVRE